MNPLAIYSLWLRDLLRFVRQRSRVVGSLATPVLFWIVLGSGLGRSFTASEGGEGYLHYYFAGTAALIVLFTSIFSTISIIEDRREGFLQGVLASPASRTSIVLGKILASTTLAFINAAIFLVLAPFAGIGLTASGTALALGVIAIVGFGLGGLGVVIAWSLESTQGFHAIMNVILVPMWLLSGAVFPSSGAAGWVQTVMRLNPLAYGVAALRDALYDGALNAPFFRSILVSVVFGAITLGLATALAHRPMRT